MQKIAEFGDNETVIHSADLSGNIRSYRLDELLPHKFKAKEIKHA
jgi:cytidine deaminase